MKIIIAVPYGGNEVHLRRCIGSLGRLDLDDLGEVDVEIVIADNSAGGHVHADPSSIVDLGGERPIEVIRVPLPGLSNVRNALVGHCLDRCDFLAMIDDSDHADPAWLKALWRTAMSTGADVVTGPVIPIYDPGVPQWFRRAGSGHFNEGLARLEEGAPSPKIGTNNALVCCRAIRCLAEVDGECFPPELNFAGSEDRVFFRRLAKRGSHPLWSPDAVVYEPIDESRSGLVHLARRGIQRGSSEVAADALCAGRPAAVRRSALVAAGAVAQSPLLLFPATAPTALRRLLYAAGRLRGHLLGPSDFYPRSAGKLPPTDRLACVDRPSVGHRPPTVDGVARSPLVSVLLPVWNEAEHIEATLDDLAWQTLTDFEVLVIDGGSTDGTLDLVQAHPAPLDIEIIENGRPSTPEQLNAGLEKARGRHVARVDGHVRLPPDYLEVVHHHLNHGYGAVGVRKTAVGRTPFGRALASALNSEASTGGSSYHHEHAVVEVDHVPYAAYQRHLVQQLGGWDERMLANQDVELDARVRLQGGRILLDGTVATYWKCRNTPGAAWRQYRRYGRGRAMTARLHPETIRLRHVVLAGLAASVPGLAAAALLRRRWAVLGAIHPAVAVAVAVRVVRGDAGRRMTVREIALTAAALYITQLAWGSSYAAALVDPALLTADRKERTLRRKQRSTYA